MKLKANQLTPTYLKKQGVAILYLVIGDEPFQVMECSDIIRQFLRSQGFSERIVLTVDKSFEWRSLDQQANSLSLFATRRWLEIRLGEKSPGNEGARALTDYVNHSSPNTVLLITVDKLDAAQQKSKWFTLLEERGTVIQIRPLEPSQWPAWITQRMAQWSLQASSEVIEMIAQRSEGHLLACAQEIEKLYLLYGPGRVELSQVLETVADSARFEIFDWVDTVLAGHVSRCVRQLQGLRAEGYEPVLVIWALNREIRSLCQMAFALDQGQAQEQIFKAYRVWQQRKGLISNALKKHSHPRFWQKCLQQSIKIERIIKGVDRGDPWEELMQLSLIVAGVNLMDDQYI